MNKSISNQFINQKSLSGLHNINAYDIEIKKNLSIPNFPNVASTLTTLQTTSSTTDFSNIDENVLPDQDDTRSLGSQTKRWQTIYGSTILATQFMHSLTAGNSLGINASGKLLIYKNLLPSSNVTIGESNSKFSHVYANDITTSNVNGIDNAITTLQSDVANNAGSLSNLNTGLGNLTNTVAANQGNITLLQDKTAYQSINSFSTLIFAIPNNSKCKFTFNGNDRFDITNTIQCHNTLRTKKIVPQINNVSSIGSSTLKYTDIFATNGTIQTSDERDKYYIQTLEQDKMLDFIKALRPVRFKWKSEKEKKTPRFHFGLIAQEISKILPFDAGLLIHDKENDTYGLRYTEMIGPLISVIQDLIKRIEILESKVPI